MCTVFSSNPSYIMLGILWNFAKFLCDENGVPVKRFGPSDNPLSFENAIIELLEKK